MIDSFARALRGAGLDLEPLQISELLWIAAHLPVSRRGPSDQAQPVDQAPIATPLTPAEKPEATLQDGKTTLEEEGALRASVFADVRAARSTGDGSRARAVALPALEVMPDRQRLRRALRPFARKRRSDWRRVFDEAATADRTAENDGLLSLVYHPALESWFDVMLVIERVASMHVWADRIDAFATLLEDRSGFHEVQRYALEPDARGFSVINRQGARSPAETLARTGRQRLVLLVSDGTSPAWRSGLLQTLLHTWASQMSVAVVNPLPEVLWPRTAMGVAEATVATVTPGPRNAQLSVTAPWWDFDPLDGRLPLPVVGLEPVSVERWARTIMAAGGAEARAVLVSSRLPSVAATPAFGSPPGASERLSRFALHASEPARLLATYLSAVPLTLPTMRLVQRAMLPKSEPVHLAEVFLGGLIERVTPPQPAVPADRVEYDFVGDLRQRLQEGMFEDEAIRVLSLVANLLDRLSGEPGRRTTFSALVADARGAETLPDNVLPLASVSRPLLERLGYSSGAAGAIQAEGTSALGRDIRVSAEATFTHTASGQQLSWSFDNRRLAILHGNGVSIASATGGWTVHDLLVNDLAWTARPRYRVAIEGGPRPQSSTSPNLGPDLQLLLLDPLLEAFADALRDGGRRIVALDHRSEPRDGQENASEPLIPVVVFSKDGIDNSFKLLEDLKDRADAVLDPIVVVLPGVSAGWRERIGRDVHVLDWTVIDSEEGWKRRRIAAELGAVANLVRQSLDHRESALTNEERRWTTCAWTSSDRIAVGLSEWPRDVSRVVLLDAARTDPASDEALESVWETARPFASLAGLGEHAINRVVCGTSSDGLVFATSGADGGQIQAGLGLGRQVRASASGRAFAYTHNGSGILVWGSGFERVRINGGRGHDESTRGQTPLTDLATQVRKYPVAVVGFSLVDLPEGPQPSGDIRLDVFWATGHIESFRVGQDVNATDENGPPPESSWNVNSRIRAGTTSPDGRLLVVAGDDGVTVWDYARRQALASLELPEFGERPALEFSRDGRFLAVSSGQTTRVFLTSRLPGLRSPDLANVSNATSTQEAPPASEAQSTRTEIYVITGRVQGVGFRSFAETEARSLGVEGEARNLPDGSVEVTAKGPDDRLSEYQARLRKGPPGARISDLVIKRPETGAASATAADRIADHERAVIAIGVSRTLKLPPLPAAVRAAHSVAEWARVSQGIPGQNVVLLSDESRDVKADDVFDAIERLISTGSLKQLILYFAGYAINIGFSEQWLLTRAPADTSAAIDVQDNVAVARLAGIPHVVFISDTCRVAAPSINAINMVGTNVFPTPTSSHLPSAVDVFYSAVVGSPAHEPGNVDAEASKYQADYTRRLIEALSGREPGIQDTRVGLSVVTPRALRGYLTRPSSNSVGGPSPDARIESEPDAWLARFPAIAR